MDSFEHVEMPCAVDQGAEPVNDLLGLLITSFLLGPRGIFTNLVKLKIRQLGKLTAAGLAEQD
jgi:hypothetical protein